MKTNYWQAHQSYSVVLVLIAAFSMAAIGAVERFHTKPAEAYRNEKLAAATLARKAMDEVKDARLEAGIGIDPAVDPSRSGLIGCLSSPVTSNHGYLPAKQTTINPNFAAVVVSMLKEAGAEKGDTIAVGFSGSFPAMNICVISAIQSLELRPVIICSASASQWGANHPQLLWIDMERRLYERQVFRYHSVAASVGGIEDQGIGMSPKGVEMLNAAIRRNKLDLIEEKNYLDSVNRRMALYGSHAAGEPIKVYINVGGGTTSVGTSAGKRLFSPGLNRRKPFAPLPVDSVMGRFAGQGVPVIHLERIKDLATRYGLPIQPVEVPEVGDGAVYSPQTYNKWLAGGLLAMILASLFFVGRSKRPLANMTLPTRKQHRDVRQAPLEEEPLPI